MSDGIRLRSGERDDLPFLEEMLHAAFHWSAGIPAVGLGALRQAPEFAKLLRDWGERPGDTALIAQLCDAPVGAAWYRHWSEDEHSYGFVAEEVPELAVGVVAAHRSRGVGRALLTELCGLASRHGLPGLSLSVDPANFARDLYLDLGFREVGRSGTSVTMLKRF